MAESVANGAKERDSEEEDLKNAEGEEAQRRASKGEAGSSKFAGPGSNNDAGKNNRWSQFTTDGSQVNRSAPQGGAAKANQRGIDEALQRNMFDNLGAGNFNETQAYDETPKQVRKDSDTFGKGTATKHNGVSCESIEREKSVCSSNKDLVFNKKKSTHDRNNSKKSRKE